MVRGAVAKGVAACAVAALAAAGGARAQDAAAQAVSVDDIAAQIDFSTLASDPMQAITLLPMLGFSQQCQSDVIGAGANCLPDLMGLQALMGDEELTALFEKYMGVDPSTIDASNAANVTAQAAAMPVLTDEQIQEIIDVVLPKARATLMTKDADGNGILSPMCCMMLTPLVTDNCMCTETAMNLVYSMLSKSDPPVTDLNPYMKFVKSVMDKLQCSSLDNMVFYPSPQCPVSRRLGLF